MYTTKPSFCKLLEKLSLFKNGGITSRGMTPQRVRPDPADSSAASHAQVPGSLLPIRTYISPETCALADHTIIESHSRIQEGQARYPKVRLVVEVDI